MLKSLISKSLTVPLRRENRYNCYYESFCPSFFLFNFPVKKAPNPSNPKPNKLDGSGTITPPVF